MKPKFAILVGDGMADFPVEALGGKTPLEYAKTPNMDYIARNGTIGLVSTVPEGLPPGSDVANLSLMGYDPALYYTGRAPIEAASMGIPLSPSDTAFRCNLVTLTDGRMEDYSAGHIETAVAHEIIDLLNARLGTPEGRFFPGVSYRHLLVLSDFPDGCWCTPPHDISGREFASYLPEGPGSDDINALMEQAREILASAPVNLDRISNGLPPASDIWLWGNGKAVTLPTLADRYGLSGSVISAVDLVRGLGVLAGLNVRKVPGATGYLGTNYAGKTAAAREALSGGEDFVFLHIEAPDEVSHEGSLEKKLAAIEEFDKYVVGEMIRFQQDTPGLSLLVAPDHATPVALKTHHAAPVPFVACGPAIRAEYTAGYSEPAASGKHPFDGPGLFEHFINGTLQE
jgi:2,3-bisphosphoglycerate-independent phosphoglycerate mutase